MSSAESCQSRTPVEEVLQSAQLVNEHTAPVSPSLEDGQSLSELSDEVLEPSPDPEEDANLTSDDVNDNFHAQLSKYAAAVEHEERGHRKSNESPGDSAQRQNNLSPFQWRDLTMAERELSASLNRARSGNLGIHLYNVCKLKQARRTKVPNEDGFMETKDIPKGWATWPMPPHLVPRDHEAKKWEDEDWRVGPYVRMETKPGDELRELLTARVLKTAKERLGKRQSTETPEDDEEGRYPESTITTDDDMATQTLRPSVQHVMEKLDGLLMGLHHARSYYSIKRTSTAAGQASTKSASSSPPGAMTSKKRKTPSFEQAEVSSHSESEANVSEDLRLLREQKVSNTVVRGKTLSSNLGRRGQIGLRDWNDVLCLASMTGVDLVVVDRAASRCSYLIGEGMSLPSCEYLNGGT